MQMTMHKILLAFACLACAGDGRRVIGSSSQASAVKESTRKQPVEALAGLLLGLDSAAAFNSAVHFSARNPALAGLGGQARRAPDANMEFKLFDESSLAAKMFGSVAGGVKDLAEKAGVDLRSDEEKEKIEKEKQAEIAKIMKRTAKAKDMDDASDLNARAQTGNINFNDFITMAEAYSGLGGQDIPGMPTMTNKEKEGLADKFSRHRSIVDVMLDEEMQDPQILLEEVKQGTGPRIQRLSKASAVPETEVAMFLFQFEAMRESTARIAAGEDPDAVTESIGDGPAVNRKQKRAAKKRDKKIKDKQKR
mmetsp:Transcript_1917/g.3117  ORF Transcript_1917/g.3117 Transcript_1917/m.3117 type:complete len:308 (+) Transcript_1917:42-965(+)